MAQNEFTRDAAPDGIHGSVEFNEFHDAEFWENIRASRARREYIIDKVAPYLIVAGMALAFIVIGYIESGL